jgi:hypothetical protein
VGLEATRARVSASEVVVGDGEDGGDGVGGDGQEV